jgi:hypothetical protein
MALLVHGFLTTAASAVVAPISPERGMKRKRCSDRCQMKARRSSCGGQKRTTGWRREDDRAWGRIMELRFVATTFVASTVGALMGTLAAPFFSWVTTERQIDAKMLEMGMGILREAPKADDDPIRSWAIKVVEKKSAINFTDAQKAALLKKTSSSR